tara:strand:- start:155 stop:556 length:402 start_codon:yes stop_codon:yes gene_type:complete
MSSWNTEHLMQLKEITNHKVIYDGYEFVWMVRLDGNWIRRYVRNFSDYNTPISWIHFNLSRWGNEYVSRRSEYLKEMRSNLEADIKIAEISREANVTTKQKVLEVINLKPKISSKEIADILDITVRSVERHRK